MGWGLTARPVKRLRVFASSPLLFLYARKLSLRLREITMPFDDVKQVEPKAKPKKKDVNVLLPWWALAYFPIMFLVGALFSIGDPFGKFYVFVFSGMALLVLTPAYAVITILLTVKRIKNNTNTIKITLFQLCPLIIYIFWLVTVLTFGGSPA